LYTAFRKGSGYALHILNLGAAREANFEGLTDGAWQITETTESTQYQQKGSVRSTGGKLLATLPAKALVTLTTGP